MRIVFKIPIGINAREDTQHYSYVFVKVCFLWPCFIEMLGHWSICFLSCSGTDRDAFVKDLTL